MKIQYRTLFTFVVLLLLSKNLIYAQQHEIVRIATYNLLNYPNSYTQRNNSFIDILNEFEPDILVTQEMASQFGVNTFLTEVLSSKYSAGTFIPNPSTNFDNAIFYKDSLFNFISNVPISTALRDISQFTLVHNFSGDTLIIYSLHLKASQGYEQQRLAEVNNLRNVTDNLPPGTSFIVAGDFNMYTSSEPGYQRLIEQTGSGYFIDPQTAGNWHNSSSFESIHTQSTMTTSHWGGSTGGLDDRFDMILLSQAVSDTGGITYIDNSYIPFGNDGQHLNKAINDPPYGIVVTQAIANALNNASDHLPVYADFDFGFVSDVEIILRDEMNFTLQQNFPNPFNPTTRIQYTVGKMQFVSIKVYDVLGNDVATLVNEVKLAGNYEVDFDGSELPSGLYIYRMMTQDFADSKKFLLLK
jgi:endonuclease/exonuclease/phosphatase family metal-dependent hydrolase